MMKKTVAFAAILLALLLLSSAALRPDNQVISKEGGCTVVNTTTIGQKVRGFRGPTPLKIYIKGGKIKRVEALDNTESPQFFQKVKAGLLGKWNGMSLSKAAHAEVDGVSGATFSSKAVKQNVKLGIDYYNKHKNDK